MRMKRATTGSGSSLSTGVSLSTFPWKVCGEAGIRAAPHPGLAVGAVPRAVTHHLLIAVGVHRPCLAVIAEAHEEGGHKVVTGEQTVVRAGLLCQPKSQVLRQPSCPPGPKNLRASRVRGARPGSRSSLHACCVAWVGGLLISSLPWLRSGLGPWRAPGSVSAGTESWAWSSPPRRVPVKQRTGHWSPGPE